MGRGAALRVEVASQPTTTVARGSATYGEDTTATLTATVTSGGSPVRRRTVTFTFDGQDLPGDHQRARRGDRDGAVAAGHGGGDLPEPGAGELRGRAGL
ncbi:MAG: hypothetical protein U0232_03420 [Thermomicrobiales bacterium]